MAVVKNPPAPGTDEWKRMVTASKVAPMITNKSTGDYLGIGYISAYEQFMEMAGKWERTIDADTQAMFEDAHDAEDYAVNVWKRKNPGWRTSKGEVAYTDESRGLRGSGRAATRRCRQLRLSRFASRGSFASTR